MDKDQNSGAPGSGKSEVSREEFDRIFREIYPVLQQIAKKLLPGNGSVSPGTLVHEAYLRLRRSRNLEFENETHFKRLVARAMRFVLVDHLDARRERATLLEDLAASSDPIGTVIDIHRALTAFEKVDPRRADLVDQRFFGGLKENDIAAGAGRSLASIKRDLDFARAWLRNWISKHPDLHRD